MEFNDYLKEAIKRLEEQTHDRRATGQARQLLLPHGDSEKIQHLVREIYQHGRQRNVE